MSWSDAPSRRVIDLTNEEEEEEEATNDGLPRYQSSSDGLSRRDATLGRNYIKLDPASASSNSRSMPRLSNGNVTHNLMNGGITSSQRPVAHAAQRSRRALDESQHNTLHVAKRQKLSGGESEYGGRSVSALPNGRSSPAIITGAMRSAAASSSSGEETRKNIPPSLSLAGRPQTLVAKIDTIDAVRFEQVLDRQVFPHISETLLPYHSQLSKTQRKDIGTSTTHELVKDPSFAENLKSNNCSLSPEFERQLANKAESLVKRYVFDANNGLGIFSQRPSKEISVNRHLSATGNNADTPPHAAPQDSSSSVEPDKIFEESRDDHGGSSQHGRSSVSPMTPISNDVHDQSSRDNPLASIEAQPISRENDGVGAELLERRRPARVIKSTRPAEPSYVPKKRIRRWHKKPKDWVEDPKPSSFSPANENTTAFQPLSRKVSVVPAVEEVSHSIRQSAAKRRPYLGLLQREAMIQALKRRHMTGAKVTADDFLSNHVPFSDAEADLLGVFIRRASKRTGKRHKDPFQEIVTLIASLKGQIDHFTRSIDYDEYGFAKSTILQGRDSTSISAFLKDAAEDSILESTSWLPPPPQTSEQSQVYNPITALLRHREIHGLEPVRVRKALVPYNQVISSYMEDCLVLKGEWIDSSGDVVALTWTSNHAFVVGALTHFDPKHMQYNKPGNLLVGSIAHDTLRAYPDHKIVRPIITSEEDQANALEAMRQTQDPWLYASVVSASHSISSGYTFTSSFDHTAKVWRVASDGSSMELCGIWQHEARVNFVATSEHHDRIATGSETNEDAVRVYNLDTNAISQSPYDRYGGNKAQQHAGDIASKWAYQPATMKWARAPQVANLLLVGYSPRAPSGDDTNIPEDKRNTGELCVWDYDSHRRFDISSSRSSNVFEAVWHPSQPIFAAATSPSGNYNTHSTKSQVRIFALNDNLFTMIIALDCPAIDINELTIMPNSVMKAFVTASCTDAKTYVWDTAQGEDPIHVLEHGESLDTPDTAQGTIPVEEVDGGVTFASWGATVDRFYTGASDGKLKAWDVRKTPGQAFVRDVLEVTGGIASGAFKEDYRQLLVGDCTGKIYLLGIDEDESDDEVDASTKELAPAPTSGILPATVKGAKGIIPHPEPAPPAGYETIPSVQQLTSTEFEDGLLRYYPGRGAFRGRHMVFQGPNYEEMGMYRFEAHVDSDGTQPLLAEFLEKQQFNQRGEEAPSFSSFLSLPTVGPADKVQQRRNEDINFDFEKLSLDTQSQLHDDDVDLAWDWYDTTKEFPLEEMPSLRVFKTALKRKESKGRGESGVELSKADDVEA